MVDNEHKVHPNRRLGRKPKVDKPRLKLADFLTGTVPTPTLNVPTLADHFAQVSEWGLYNNNLVGICGPTSVANSRRLVSRYLTGTQVNPPQSDVDDLYKRSGNPGYTGDPNNPGEDNGVVIQDMLSQVVKGGLGPDTALGFAEVDHTNIEELRAATAIFGFLILGVDLQVAQQSQTDKRLWTYKRSGEWGGHAILGGRYKDDPMDPNDRFGVVTWAEVVDMTDDFIDQQLDEAWVVIWPEHLRDSAFLSGVDMAAFAAAFMQLTGRPFPHDVPITPAPAPDPGATPLALVVSAEVAEHAHRAAARSHQDVNVWADHHFRNYFNLTR